MSNLESVIILILTIVFIVVFIVSLQYLETRKRNSVNTALGKDIIEKYNIGTYHYLPGKSFGEWDCYRISIQDKKNPWDIKKYDFYFNENGDTHFEELT